jgi:hypothetical protein
MKTITSDILNHMLKKAEETMLQEGWSQHDIMVFKNDPVIRLLYGACAEEIGDVHDEIFHSQQRLIRKAIEHFIPEEFNTPVPAHAILQAYPLGRNLVYKIGPDYQLKIKRQEVPPKDFIFTPAGNYNLYQADVEYLLFRNRMYRYEDGKKRHLVSGNVNLAFPDDILWLGFRDLNKVLNATKENIPVYFNLPQEDNDAYIFFDTLKYCDCYVNGTKITVSHGLSQNESDLMQQRITRPDSMVYKFFRDVHDWYHKNWVTFSNLPVLQPEELGCPGEISRLFQQGDLEKIRGEIYWMKLSFSSLIKESWILQLFCSINCFPALNLRIREEQFNVENMPVNIFPVTCDDFIVCLKSIKGKVRNMQAEIEYHLLDEQTNATVGNEGQAILRKSGLGRQEPEKLKSMLDHISNMLREETILLTRDGSKEDLDRLGRLHRAIIDFEKSIETEQGTKRKFSASIILKPFSDHSKIFISYWTTSAEMANQVKPSSGEDASRQCEIYFGPEIKPDSLRLITVTLGGRKQPTEEEHIDTLRKLILTRGRIVTAEDIRSFCYEHFNPVRITVEVKKIVAQSSTPSHGIERMISVEIRFLDKIPVKEEEIHFLEEELRQKLEKHSTNVLPYRIRIS